MLILERSRVQMTPIKPTIQAVGKTFPPHLVPKKVKLLIRFFEPFRRSRVFHFFLAMFAKVDHHPVPPEPSVEIYTHSKIDISGYHETMQNALASIV